MSLKMKFATALIAVGIVQPLAASPDNQTETKKTQNVDAEIDALAACSSFITMSQNYKLTQYSSSKDQSARMFFMQQAEKKVSFENFALRGIKHTSTYSQVYSNSQGVDTVTHTLVREKIRQESEACMKYYEARIK